MTKKKLIDKLILTMDFYRDTGQVSAEIIIVMLENIIKSVEKLENIR